LRLRVAPSSEKRSVVSQRRLRLPGQLGAASCRANLRIVVRPAWPTRESVPGWGIEYRQLASLANVLQWEGGRQESCRFRFVPWQAGLCHSMPLELRCFGPGWGLWNCCLRVAPADTAKEGAQKIGKSICLLSRRRVRGPVRVHRLRPDRASLLAL